MFCLFRPLSHLYRLIIALFVTMFALLLVHPAFAEGGHSFRLQPDPNVTTSSSRAYFVYESTSGSTISDAVLVKNNGGSPITLVLYPSDAITGSSGGVSIATNLGEAPNKGGTWIQLSESEITLQPDEERSVPFTVNIPDTVSPGEYGATIVTQEADAAEAETQESGPVGIRFIPRTATSVLLTIPGVEPLQSQLEIAELRAETDTGQQIVANLRNIGNDGIEITQGNLTIRDTNGTVIQDLPLQLGYFLAGDTLSYRAGIESELPPGDYDVTLSLTYLDQAVEQTIRLSIGAPEQLPEVREDASVEQTTESSDVPLWVIVAGFSVVAILLLLIFWVMMLARRQSRQQQQQW